MSSPLKSTALVIDDELQMRRLLRVCLEANGYRVSEAATGKDGIAEAAQHPPDVVILDLGLPDMEGVAVLKRLREWSRVPVVVLSVRDREEDKIAALDAGADDYVRRASAGTSSLIRLTRSRNCWPPGRTSSGAGTSRSCWGRQSGRTSTFT